jgi:hypothetical protein
VTAPLKVACALAVAGMAAGAWTGDGALIVWNAVILSVMGFWWWSIWDRRTHDAREPGTKRTASY